METNSGSALYPVLLRLRGINCLVVGGGAIAERKLLSLLEAGADRVRLVSPAATERLASLAADGRLEWLQRDYRDGDLEDMRLVFAATDSREVNGRIASDAENAGIWANIADAAERGNMVTPAIVRRGDLLLTVSVSGASPAFAARLKRELAERYGEPYGAAAERLGRLRELAQRLLPDEELRRQLLRLAADEELERLHAAEPQPGGAKERQRHVEAGRWNKAGRQTDGLEENGRENGDRDNTGPEDAGQWLERLLEQITRG